MLRIYLEVRHDRHVETIRTYINYNELLWNYEFINYYENLLSLKIRPFYATKFWSHMVYTHTATHRYKLHGWPRQTDKQIHANTLTNDRQTDR